MTTRPQSRLEAALRSAVTVEELERWEEHGAIWRALEVSDERAVIELCTCYGEPVDQIEGNAPELIEFVRARGAAELPAQPSRASR